MLSRSLYNYVFVVIILLSLLSLITEGWTSTELVRIRFKNPSIGTDVSRLKDSYHRFDISSNNVSRRSSLLKTQLSHKSFDETEIVQSKKATTTGDSRDESPRRIFSNRVIRFFRRYRLLLILLPIILAFIPTRSASAASTSLQAAAGSYSTNPPLPVLTAVRSPLSRTAELQLTGRLLFAALLGACVGKERSGKQHHSAGVRTMALVSLGAAAFTVCSMYGFAAAGRYDPSRMASSVASGVGFIGAGVITTTGSSNNSGSIVHGLTTAASVWLSAAVGVGCGVGMLYFSTIGTMITISVLRIGRISNQLQQLEDKTKKKLKQKFTIYDQEDEELLRKTQERRVEERGNNHSTNESNNVYKIRRKVRTDEAQVIQNKEITDIGDERSSMVEKKKKKKKRDYNIGDDDDYHGSNSNDQFNIPLADENNPLDFVQKKQKLRGDFDQFENNHDQFMIPLDRPSSSSSSSKKWNNETDHLDI